MPARTWTSGRTAGLIAISALSATEVGAQQVGSTYTNPLPVVAEGQAVESCADPSVIETPGGIAPWTMYCTTDPLSADDRDVSGELAFRLLPMFRSSDLVHWEFEGAAFDRDPMTATPAPPGWADPDALLWAPEAEVIDGRHYLFFGVTDLADDKGGEPGCDSDGAIGYAVAEGPLGPWEAAGDPLIAPRRNGAGCDFLWTYDPEVIATPEGRRLIYYGSYHGGIEVRELDVAADGSLSADPATAVPVAIPNRYEGAEVVRHEGAWWIFASASNCCNGPQTGYAMFVGRSDGPTGPFLDRNGVSFLEPRVGGTPVLVQNGNRWVGPGHGTAIADAAGRWWMLYHAIDEAAPYFEGEVGFTRRPVLLDPLDWVGGWPVVVGGPSDRPRPAPASASGRPPARDPVPAGGVIVPALTDEFHGPALEDRWTWLREPGGGSFGIEDGVLVVRTSNTDLYEDADNAPILLEASPEGDFIVEARVALDVPAEGCCYNFVQAGVMLHGDDNNYLKLVVVSIWETRQIEFAREVSPVPDGYPRYGSTVTGPPGAAWTDLRLEVRRDDGAERVTAYTRGEGQEWVKGGTWTHDLENTRIGLLAMGGPGGFPARFDHLRVFALRE